MQFTKSHWIGITFSIVILLADFVFFFGENIFFFLIGIALLVMFLPFIINLAVETNVEKDKDERFLEFARNLAESVKAGTPIGKSIINMKGKNFGNLTPHIDKLTNQISLGIPIRRAFQTFANDVGSPSVKRAIALIREAESAGGQIHDILDSVSSSVYQIEKLKKERKAAIYNLVVQGYIIFFIFIGIMLIMQFKILPLTADIGSVGALGGSIDSAVENTQTAQSLSRPFLYLLLIQGIFTGLTIGKLAQGSMKAGIKHSFILTIAAFLISTGANAFL